MAGDVTQLLETAQSALAAQEQELQLRRAQQVRSVAVKTAAGSGNIDETFGLDAAFRLVFIRAHFSGGTGTAAFIVSLDSANGSAHDTELFKITQAGTNQDVHLRIGAGDVYEPSPWTFQAGDYVRIQWANPDSGNMTWGLELGLALAS